MFVLKFSPLAGYLVGKQATGKNAHGFEYSVVQTTMSYGGNEGLRKSNRMANIETSHRHGRELEGGIN